MRAVSRLPAERAGALRAVYAGRFAGGLGEPRCWDEYDALAPDLAARVAELEDLVLLDPLSFPFDTLGEPLLDSPLTVCIHELPIDDAVPLLRPLLDHLTPLDHVVTPKPDDWAEIASATALPAHQITPCDEPSTAAVAAELVERWRAESVVEVEAAFGYACGFVDDLVTRHLTDYGAHQRSDLAALRAHLRPGDTVLDVGAHIGSFTIPIAQQVGPEGRVVAFEPVPETADLLVENVARNGLEDWTRIVRSAVGTRDTERRRFVRDRANTGGTRLVSELAHGAATTVTSLDEWWAGEGRPPVDMIKLDVEGMELAALRGGATLLRTERPMVFMEVAPEQLATHGALVRELEDVLRQLDYSFWINTTQRNRPDDSFRLERVTTLAADRLYDLLALPASSDREATPTPLRPSGNDEPRRGLDRAWGWPRPRARRRKVELRRRMAALARAAHQARRELPSNLPLRALLVCPPDGPWTHGLRWDPDWTVAPIGSLETVEGGHWSSLAVADDRYDLVVAVDTLGSYTVPGKRALLGELFRIGRPGGQVALVDTFVRRPDNPRHDREPVSMSVILELATLGAAGAVALAGLESLSYPHRTQRTDALAVFHNLEVPRTW